MTCMCMCMCMCVWVARDPASQQGASRVARDSQLSIHLSIHPSISAHLAVQLQLLGRHAQVENHPPDQPRPQLAKLLEVERTHARVERPAWLGSGCWLGSGLGLGVGLGVGVGVGLGLGLGRPTDEEVVHGVARVAAPGEHAPRVEGGRVAANGEHHREHDRRARQLDLDSVGSRGIGDCLVQAGKHTAATGV